MLDLGVTSGMKLKQIITLAKLGQKLGLTQTWIGDDISKPHEVFTAASIIKVKAMSMNVGIGITSPLIRNISTIARASVTLAEIDGNENFRLGLGIGGFQDLAKLGITLENPETLLHDATFLLRKIWKCETTSFERTFTLKNYSTHHGLGNQFPIFFGVRGPKMLRLAGDLADGVILSGPKTYLKKAVNLVKDSLRNSEQPKRDFTFVIWVPTMLTKKPQDLDLVKEIVATILSDTPRKVLEMTTMNPDQIEKIKETLQHKEKAEASKIITNDMIEEVVIHGSAEQICQSFESLENLGVNEVVYGPPFGANAETSLTEIAKEWRRFS